MKKRGRPLGTKNTVPKRKAIPDIQSSIDMIDTNKYLNQIMSWLEDGGITYTSSEQPFLWKNLLGQIRADDRFYLDTEEDGESKPAGWECLRMDAGEEEEGEGEDESEFEEDSEAEEESDDDESFDEDEEEESDFDEEEELEEKGKSWDELENDAAASDRARRDWNNDDDRGRNKRKGGSSGGGASKRRR